VTVAEQLRHLALGGGALLALMKMVPWRNFPSPALDLRLERRPGDEHHVVRVLPGGCLTLAHGDRHHLEGDVPDPHRLPHRVLPAPKSLSATVPPSTATLVPVSTSESVKRVPSAIGQLRISK
jgi:hypothetical protein